jgi:hypothetical protein
MLFGIFFQGPKQQSLIFVGPSFGSLFAPKSKNIIKIDSKNHKKNDHPKT